MLGGRDFDYLVDAIDNAKAKAAVIAYCRARNIPMLTIGSAGGQTDPTLIAVRDLSKTEQEPLLKRVRKLLAHRIWFSPWREKQIQCRRRVFHGAVEHARERGSVRHRWHAPPASRA